MQIYPAIDLKDNCCVRLYQGEFDQATLYSDDPIAMAKKFAAAGSTWLHLVDLDAAKNPTNNQYALIAKLINEVRINVQVGGGIRSIEQIETLLANGAKRVVIGSQAVYQPEMVKKWLQELGAEQIVLAFDIKLNNDNAAYICTQGWQETTEFKLEDIISNYLTFGLRHILCTDIAKDGTLKGPNLTLYKKLMAQFPQLRIQASGGIASLQDLQQLKAISLAGAIMGRALYENKINLSEALTC